MRSFLVSLGLLTVMPLCADAGTGGHWSFDVHSWNATLAGHYQGLQDNQPFSVDLKDDLALASQKPKVGFGAEYQGHRFGLEVTSDSQTYLGANTISKVVTINGQSFNVGAKVNSIVKSNTTTLNWTIRALSFEHVWLGVDLGVRQVSLQIDASGFNGLTNTTATADYKASYPVPQVGLSAGVNFFGGRVVGRAYYHTLDYSGASFNVAGADLRFFPVSWLGLKAFTASEKLTIPKGAISNDADIALDESGTGFGLVLRF